MSGVRTPSLRLSRTTTRTVPPSRRNARSCSSAQTCALDRWTSSRTALRGVAQRQDEEPCPPVLAGSGVADHRPLAVVDLCFLPPGRRDDHPGLDGGLLPERRDEAPHARISSRKAMVIDQVLPDGHGIAPPADGLDDQLSVGFAGARPRRSAGAVPGHGRGVTRVRAGRRCRRRVGGHLRRNGRFCGSGGRPAPTPHHHAGRL